MKLGTLTLIVVILASHVLNAQTVLNTPCTESSLRTVSATERPDAVVDLTRVAYLRMATRKTSFYLGETLLIDVAILNQTDSAIYVPAIDARGISITNNKDKKVNINFYSVVNAERGFLLVEAHSFRSINLHLIVGCSKNLFERRDKVLTAENDLAIVESDLFVSLGHGCIDIRNEETLFLSVAALNNSSIVLSTDGTRTALTAIGSLDSNSVRVEVKKER